MEKKTCTHTQKGRLNYPAARGGFEVDRRRREGERQLWLWMREKGEEGWRPSLGGEISLGRGGGREAKAREEWGGERGVWAGERREGRRRAK